jgi:hypothetical protein
MWASGVPVPLTRHAPSGTTAPSVYVEGWQDVRAPLSTVASVTRGSRHMCVTYFCAHMSKGG